MDKPQARSLPRRPATNQRHALPPKHRGEIAELSFTQKAESNRGYAVHTYVYVKRKMVALTADDIDCIIAYIVPLDLWYVLPVESFSPCKNLWFYPHGSKKGSRFESFRQAWWLLAADLKPESTEPPTRSAGVDV